MSWNSKSSGGLGARIAHYLRSQPDGCASAEEIVRQVMALSGVSPSLADHLVETALEDEQTPIQRLPDGHWALVGGQAKKLNHSKFVALVVDRAADGVRLRVGWAVVEGGKETHGSAAILVPGLSGTTPPDLGAVEVVVLSRRQAGLKEALRWFRMEGGAVSPPWELRRAVQNLFPGQKVRSPGVVADLLGETWLEGAPVDLQAERLAALWGRVLEIAEEMGIEDVEALRRLLGQEPELLDFSRFAFGPEKIARLPARPGVYLMRDRTSQVVYVGKAKNLAARVPAYFRSPMNTSERDRRIVKEIVDFEVVELGSELEALLVEQRLIGLYRPRLNTQTEVHPREHWERVRGNYALVLPSSRQGHVEVFLITRGGRVRQIRTRSDLPNRLELEAAVSALFFEGSVELGVSVEGEIAFSWMARAAPWEQVVLVDRCANAEACVEQIRGLAREMLGRSGIQTARS